MPDDRTQCALEVLSQYGEYWALSLSDLVGVENGHHFYRGWHVGWVWGSDDEHPCFLDILSEHRLAGMDAKRVFPDGATEPIEIPWAFRLVGQTPEEHERLAQEFFEHNRRAYADLRERGLLPAEGANIGSQDINEFLNSGGMPDRSSDGR